MEKTFKWDQCHKSFAYRRIIECHQRIHNEETPFKCDQCDKSYAQNSHLWNSSVNTHRGETI